MLICAHQNIASNQDFDRLFGFFTPSIGDPFGNMKTSTQKLNIVGGVENRNFVAKSVDMRPSPLERLDGDINQNLLFFDPLLVGI